MSHDTHNHHQAGDDKPVLQFRTGISLVLILAGLFLAGIAFAKAMGGDEENEHGEHHTEMVAPESGKMHETENSKHEEHGTTTAPAAEGHAHEAAPAEQHH